MPLIDGRHNKTPQSVLYLRKQIVKKDTRNEILQSTSSSVVVLSWHCHKQTKKVDLITRAIQCYSFRWFVLLTTLLRVHCLPLPHPLRICLPIFPSSNNFRQMSRPQTSKDDFRLVNMSRGDLFLSRPRSTFTFIFPIVLPLQDYSCECHSAVN